MSNFTSNGGGATHIAKVTGQLSSLSSNLSDILIVSGGGGGGFITPGSSDLQPYIDKLKSTTCGASNQYSLLSYKLNRDGSRWANLSNIYSFITPTGNFNINTASYESLYFCTVGTVDITNNGGGSITADYDFVNAPNDCVSISYQTMYGDIKTKKGNYGVTVRQWSGNYLTLDDLLNISTIPSFTTSFNTMEACLQYLTQHFRHINVTVNGIPWEAYLNHVYSGADAGGISGNGSNSANQSVGYGFGLGENGVSISPPAEYSYLRKINTLVYNGAPDFLTSEYVLMRADGWTWYPDFSDYDSCSYYSNHWILHYGEYSTGGQWYQSLCPLTGILRIDYNTRTKTATYSNANFRTALWTYTGYSSGIAEGNTIYDFRLYYGTPPDWSFSNWGTENYSFTTSFASTSEAMSYFYSHFANVDLYVDGAPWVVVGR